MTEPAEDKLLFRWPEAGSVWERRTLAAAGAALRGTHSIRPEIPKAA